MRSARVVLAAICLSAICLSASVVHGAALASSPTDLALNDIQLVGSHNSYKLAMPADRFAELKARNAATAMSLEYQHRPLTEQLELGIRKLELDVFYDPAGELFGRGGGSQFPVLHVQNLDDRSSCVSLLVCLTELKRWSDQHPDHVPIFVSFNAKDAVIDRPGFLRPLPFGEDAWLAMDAEIRSVLDEKLITPRSVFVDGVLHWPRLDSVRGSFVAILDEGGEKRAVYAGRWRERAMFANLPEHAPGAAILIVNDPIADFERIRSLVRRGFIVRTRADADTREARSGDVRRRNLAFASGAQLVSTDYYLPAAHFGTSYMVAPLSGVGCNPVRRSGCAAASH